MFIFRPGESFVSPTIPRMSRRKLETDWTSGYRTAQVQSLNESLVDCSRCPSPSAPFKFEIFLSPPRRLCSLRCFLINLNFLQRFVVFNGTSGGVGPYKCSLSPQSQPVSVTAESEPPF